MTDSLKFTTGHEFTLDEIEEMGNRIAALRMAFNVREGVSERRFSCSGPYVGKYRPWKAVPWRV